MKVLLIQAGMPDLRRPYDVVEKGQLMMPIGLGYLGAVLKKKGIEVRVKDFVARKFVLELFRDELDNFKPDIAAISSYTATYNQAIKIAGFLKSKISIPVVMGGLHVSFLPGETLKNREIDFVIRGEGEETLIELIEYLEGKRAISSIDGVSFRESDTIMHNKGRREIESLDLLPFPDWSIFENSLYKSPVTGEINAPINFGRGCPYRCNFCSVGGKKRRERKAESVINEFKWMKERYGFRNFIVTDDVHLLKGEFRKIVEGLKMENLGIRWKMTNRLDNVEKGLLFEMKKAGCQAIGYGIESPDTSTLRKAGKNILLSDYLHALRWTREAGMSVAASFMLGFQWEKREDINETIKFSASLPLYSICYNVVTYFPGTEMFDTMVRQKKINLDEINWDDFTIHKSTFPTEYVSKRELDACLEQAYDYFYFRKIREDLIRFMTSPPAILKYGRLSYRNLRDVFPAAVKAGSFYYGELLKQKGAFRKIRYLAKIIRHLLFLPEL
jgi:radical SAM superfamily enzyme YgiQ (UPF0313 family)